MALPRIKKRSHLVLATTAITLILALTLAGAFDDKKSPSPAANSSQTSAPHVFNEADGMRPVASCGATDLEGVMVSLSAVDEEAVCHTLEHSLGRKPSRAIAHKLSQLLFIIRVDQAPVSQSAKQLAYQIMNVVEARGAEDDDARIDATFEVLAKIYSGSDGHVTPNDMNVALRAGPDIAKNMSDDGLFSLAAFIQLEKKAAGD